MNDPTEPPVHHGQKVMTPEGPGEVTAYTQLPNDWRVRVKLDRGGRWIGPALLVWDPDEEPSQQE